MTLSYTFPKAALVLILWNYYLVQHGNFHKDTEVESQPDVRLQNMARDRSLQPADDQVNQSTYREPESSIAKWRSGSFCMVSASIPRGHLAVRGQQPPLAQVGWQIIHRRLYIQFGEFGKNLKSFVDKSLILPSEIPSCNTREFGNLKTNELLCSVLQLLLDSYS